MWSRTLVGVLVGGWIGVALSVYGVAEPQPTGYATASSGQQAYEPQNAIDGNLQTRWGSAFTDDEWWQIDFGHLVSLAGVQILWEEAYGEQYTIQVSDDGVQWRTVFAETAGDGKTDWVLFQPVRARFLRLQGVQRGTGWGYSIWELRPLYARQWPRVEARPSLAGGSPQNVIDGKPGTYWRASPADVNELRITLPFPIHLGGLELLWGPEFATSYTVELATAEGPWQRVAQVSQGNGQEDFVFFPAMLASRIKLRLQRSQDGRGYSLDEIRLKDGAEQATPLRLYQAMAKERPRGWYPRWLSREQEYWTVSGIPEDTAETLLAESGTIEPYQGGFTVMPFVHQDGRLISWADVEVEQALEDGYLPLPSITWQTPTWSLDMAVVAFGHAGASRSAGRYRLTNKSANTIRVRLILAIRPLQLNPKWQRGGFSPIRSLDMVPLPAGQLVRINGQEQLHALGAPAQAVALSWDQGTVLDCLTGADCPASTTAVDDDGKSEAALVYNLELAPEAASEVILVFPLQADGADLAAWQEPASRFREHWQEQRHAWHTRLDRVSIRIPEPRLIDVLKSNLAYILLNQDGPWIKPGPRNYSHSWMRDGAMTSAALLRFGMTEAVRRFLLAYLPLVDAKGWVPWIVFDGGTPVEFITNSREGHEYDSQGEWPFLVQQYVAFTGDESLLADAYPAVVRALRYGGLLRRERMTEPYRSQPQWAAYYGILPESNSHEGYYPAQHSYWDDFWYLRGLKDGMALAQRLGQTTDVAWMQAELQEARQALYASMRRVIDRDQLDYLPGCVEKGDFDPTSTAIAIMVSDEAEELPQPYVTTTFDRYYRDFLLRFVSPGSHTYTPYEVRTAEAFVRLGQRQRALQLLRTFTEHAVRPPAWNHMAEVVHGRERAPSYIGDMPHTWVGSSYISAVRALFAYEEQDRLVLAAGIAPEWAQEGIRVHDLPTAFGTIHYDLHDSAGVIRMTIRGDAAPPGGFTVRLPSAWHTKVARLNGVEVTHRDASFQFPTLPITLELQERAPHDRTPQ